MDTERKILIIDDEEDIRDIAQASLEIMKDWTVITASSAKEGITKASVDQPDAILLDVVLPDMDGLTAFQHLQKNPTTVQIPIIFLTARVRSIDLKQFADINAAAIFAKPFNPVDLADQISDSLGWSH